ncbi:hypothetical protein PviCFBP13515_02210 [Pseudomonas viridiflava]|nr:hypothetical protein PviCFBP13507_07480 [Pseudomonas viridiflava]TKK33373.1 hypothetical protein PviCFBP13515_02210 [Pseudomonas viridiflava]
MVEADLSANAVFQPVHMRRMYRPFRGQVRSHKIQFLQWLTGCLIRGGLLRDSAASKTWWGLPQPAWRLALPIAQPRRSALSFRPPRP